MPCFIRNPNTEPVTLPTPFRGILGRGQGIMVNVSAALALTILGGTSFQAGSLDVRDEPDYTGSYDSFFLDPSAIVPAVLSARAASTANLTLSGAQTIDGVAVVAEDVVLAKDQSTASENGLWIAKTGAWVRSSLMPAGGLVAGRIVVVAEGTVSADVAYTCTNNPGADIVGTSNLVFAIGSGGDALLVHKAGAETITGLKTLTGGLTVTSTTIPFIPPRMTGTQRDAIATPTAGSVVYNTTTGKLNVRGAAAWEEVTSA